MISVPGVREERTLEVLNNLLKNCLDAEESYRSAAEQVHDENLKQIFIIQAYQKAEYATKLRSEIKRLGGSIQIPGKEKNNIFEYPEEETNEILNNCEQKEADVIHGYEIAMNDEDVLWEVIPIVSRQYLETQESYNQMKYLRTNYSETFAHL